MSIYVLSMVLGPEDTAVSHAHKASVLVYLWWTSLGAQVVKKILPVKQEMQIQSLGQEDPLEKERQSTPVFLPGEFQGLPSPRDR